MISLNEAEKATYVRFADKALPRHTSYPMVPVWKSDTGGPGYRQALQRSAAAGRDLSLYVHIPWCRQLCYYCGCNKIIWDEVSRAKKDPVPPYLEAMAKEVAMVAAVTGKRPVRQVHFGGGSPTYLHPHQLTELFQILRSHFQVMPDAEISVEVDPRVTTPEHLTALKAAGVNRISFGVQDFNEKVMEAVNRHQPYELVRDFLQEVRRTDLGQVNFDLIYGLPFQTVESMARTLDQVVELAPDRIAYFRLAVIPELFKWQRRFQKKDLPERDESLQLMLLAWNRLLDAGYEFIGLDHFARPDDMLTRARDDEVMIRTFQGMTTGKSLDIIGFGPSAISILDDAFAQNVKDTGQWLKLVEEGFATDKGMHLSEDDKIRREALQQLYGHGRIDLERLSQAFSMDAAGYFAAEWRVLDELQELGLVHKEPGRMTLTEPLGRLLVRVVAAVFDAWLPADTWKNGMTTGASKIG